MFQAQIEKGMPAVLPTHAPRTDPELLAKAVLYTASTGKFNSCQLANLRLFAEVGKLLGSQALGATNLLSRFRTWKEKNPARWERMVAESKRSPEEFFAALKATAGSSGCGSGVSVLSVEELMPLTGVI